MKKLLLSIFLAGLLTTSLFSWNPVGVGSGSYAEYPQGSVLDLDSYYAKPAECFKDNHPVYIHPNKQGQLFMISLESWYCISN